MARNLSKDGIQQRQVIRRVQAAPTTQADKEAARNGEGRYCEFTINGKWKGDKPPALPE